MSNDGKYFIKCKASEILTEINSYEKSLSKSTKYQKIAMKRIIANLTIGNNEMIKLFDQVMGFYNIDELELKRMCCHYFCFYGSILPPRFFQSIIPLFMDDLSHPSPIIRSLTIKTLSYFNYPKLQEENVVPAIKTLAKDEDYIVRKSTVYAIGKLFELNPELVRNEHLLDLLSQFLLDPNIMVITATLSILNHIMEASGDDNSYLNLQLNKINALRLIELLSKSDEFSQIYILNSLMYIVPQENDTPLELVEKLIPYLQHNNSSVVINTIKVIIYFGNYIRSPQDVIPSLPKKLGNSLVSLLSRSSQIEFLTLRNIILLLLSKPTLVNFDVTMFFIQYNDPIYVKDTKLEIIYLLANSDNLHTVLRELEEYATESDVSMSRKSIRAIGNLAIKLDESVDTCIDVISNLASSGIPYVIQEAIIVMKNIYRKYPKKVDSDLLNTFVKCSDSIEEEESKSSLLWLIGTYHHLMKNPIEILKDFAFTFKTEPLDVQLTLLTAIVKYYLTNSTESESLLLSILKFCTDDQINPDLRDRGYFYWKILSSEPNFKSCTKEILLAELPIISSEQDKLDPIILEELELNFGTLASIYLKPVKSVFRLSKTKYLPSSSALQADYNRFNIHINNSNPAAKIIELNINENSHKTADSSTNYRQYHHHNHNHHNHSELDDHTSNVRFGLIRKKSKELLKSLDENTDTGDFENNNNPKLGEKLKRRMTFTKKKSTMSLRSPK